MSNAKSVLAAVSELRPDLAHKVQPAERQQLDLFHESAAKARKDHKWSFEEVEIIDGESAARHRCPHCGSIMYRRRLAGSRVTYLGPDGRKVRVRPACAAPGSVRGEQ